MAQLLEDSLFCEEFIQQCPAAVEVLNLVAQECSAGKYFLLSLLPYFIVSSAHLQFDSGMLTVFVHTHVEQLSFTDNTYHNSLSSQIEKYNKKFSVYTK